MIGECTYEVTTPTWQSIIRQWERILSFNVSKFQYQRNLYGTTFVFAEYSVLIIRQNLRGSMLLFFSLRTFVTFQIFRFSLFRLSSSSMYISRCLVRNGVSSLKMEANRTGRKRNKGGKYIFKNDTDDEKWEDENESTSIFSLFSLWNSRCFFNSSRSFYCLLSWTVERKMKHERSLESIF